MRSTPLEEAIHFAPFKPFTIHTDGRMISVDHPEQIFLTPDKSTAIVAKEDGQMSILDVGRISSLALKKRPQKRIG